ncbi:nitroreductase/quinone reductase family protein [Haloarchaeobius amylolyticus]|uniref:nitroreductase/quinone reductase family protein n=1 Tax=Haloarchaeobius amylolyticus TaxID=1198296 RepID=UPI00226D9920|nr:nitroreductase/quinone reductase family protein [Haloarchaeobius amylolyticus]
MPAQRPTPPRKRIHRLHRAVERRLANPVFRGLLRSPLHGVLDRWLVLLSYAGRESGDQYVFPVTYTRVDGCLVVVTPKADSRWWLNFRGGHPASIWYRGEERSATGAVVTGPERQKLLTRYVDDHPLLRRALGIDEDSIGTYDPRQDLAVVRFTLGPAQAQIPPGPVPNVIRGF